jgi:predicted MFS family arabinose efflux permease
MMVLSVWFDVAYLSYVPALVERHELTVANTVMETSNSTAQVVGNSVGGFLVELLTAPVAIFVDCLSYFFSAAAVWRIRKPEPPVAARQGTGIRDVMSSVAVGIRFVVRDRILAPLALAIGIYNLFWSAEMALYVYYLARDLGLGAGLIGLTLAAAGPGAVAGSAFAGKAQRTLGVAGAIISALTLFAVSALLIPLAPKHSAATVPMLMVAAFLMFAGLQLCSINVITTRQTIAPPELLARVTASFRFMAFGTAPFGSMLGGLLGALLGARGGIFAAVLGLFLAPLVVLLSPARRLRRLPGAGEPAEAPG